MKAASRPWSVVSGALVAVLACSRVPSTTPLGSGPLAREAPESVDPSLTENRVAVGVEHREAGEPRAIPSSHARSEVSPEPIATVSLPAPSGTPAAETAALDGGAIVFAGDYYGFDEAKISLGGAPPLEQRDEKAHTRVVEGSGSRLTLTLVASDTGDPICSLEAEREGSAATVQPGQRCFDLDSATVGTVLSGRATVATATLTIDLDIELRSTQGGQSITGTLAYHFEGQRR